MKTHLLFALCAMLIAVAPTYAQTTQKEIQADLLGLQIIAALQAENYAGASDLFDQYDALGVTMPPPLQLQRAVAYFRLKRYEDTKNQLLAYLRRAERGSNDYNQALSMLAEVAATKAKAAAARTPECKGKGADYEGSSLHEAAKENACISAVLLVQHGADVNAKDNQYGWTPLHHAAARNATETATLLIEHDADVNAKNNDGNTPLYNAAYRNATETAALLIEHGADVNAKNNDGETPLHDATGKYATEIADLLIQHGAGVNAKNNDGETPLHIAAEENITEIATLLIENGADMNAKNNDGETPLESMATNENLDRKEVKAMEKLFREYGRKLN